MVNFKNKRVQLDVNFQQPIYIASFLQIISIQFQFSIFNFFINQLYDPPPLTTH